MTHKPPSQARVLLLLAASLLAGLLTATLFSPREAVRRDEPMPLTEQSYVAESP
ncbi:MAG: hypothetical protein O3C40_20780 [Planctomycetota bacterium]|nr:hypothetical protein [Planctomycetota bacterium]